MIKGVTFALGACLIWGLIFVVPQLMTGFGCLEVALGRYSVYGIISAMIFLKQKMQGSCKYPLAIWIRALYFSLACTIGYYTFVVLSLRYATPAMCALILGISPITIAFYGNWKHKECSYKSLILPSILILVGLIVINAPHITSNETPSEYFLGLLCSFLALLAWSWYVVANAGFLKKNPQVCSSDWSTILGVVTLFWVVLFTLFLGTFFEDHLSLSKYLVWDDTLKNFLIGCAILGLLCSWLGAFLWNKASFYLPVSLAGQLTIFETIFGLCFVYMLQSNLPPLSEWIGIAILMIAIYYGIRVSRHAALHPIVSLSEKPLKTN